IDTGDYAAPFVVDWNKDNKKDLFVGTGEGYVYYFENKNTNENPSFKSGTLVQAGGIVLQRSSISVPWLVDWNYDGELDLIIGGYDGNVLFFAYRGNCETVIATTPTSSSGFLILPLVVAIGIISLVRRINMIKLKNKDLFSII
ncbi:MAG: FG-GAP-like repeat-containing protein, partial [Candidatus Hodarchaeota archaeon]